VEYKAMKLNNKIIYSIIFILLLLASGILYRNIQTVNTEKVLKNTLKGEIIFASGKDGLYLLRLPSGKVENINNLYKYEMVFPSYPSWSPDGTKIILSQYKDNIGLLTIIDVLHGKIEEFTNIKLDCDYSCWSPNGEYVVFLGRSTDSTDNNYRLYILSIKNHLYHLVSTMSVGPNRPTWSPDSQKIMFSSSDNRIFIANVNAEVTPELFIPVGVSPTWSPNGRFVVYRASKSIFLYDFQSKKKRKLISNFGFSDIKDFSWSADSQFILFKKLTERFSPIEIMSIKENVSITLQEFGNIKGLSWKY